MALRAILDSLDGLEEGLKALYTQKDGKFVLDVEGLEDTNGLKSALEKERKAAREFEKKIRSWQDLGKTPEEIAELIEAQKKTEEEKATKAGEWDKLKAQILEKHGVELGKKDEELKKMRGTLEKYLIDAAATDAIASAKGVPALLIPHVRSSAKVIEDNGEYVVRIVDPKGDPRVNGQGGFLTIKDLVEEMKASEVFGRAFDGTGRSGGSTPPSSGKTSGNPVLLSRADARDHAKYLAAKEAATKAGVELQLTD